jgi:hypothetical protein
VTFDLSAVKRITLVGHTNFEFRAEMINAFNNINFTPVAQTGNSATLNQVTAAQRDVNNTQNPGGRLVQFRVPCDVLIRPQAQARRRCSRVAGVLSRFQLPACSSYRIPESGQPIPLDVFDLHLAHVVTRIEPPLRHRAIRYGERDVVNAGR